MGALLALAACACVAEAPPPPPAPGLERVALVAVVDGDTIRVRRADGTQERVRYIGIDTPESVTPERPVEPWGQEASEANAALLATGTVYLERDISDRDRFGRLLRYVWVHTRTGDLLLINAELLARGLAEVTTFPPDVKHRDTLLAAEAEAREVGLGLWSDRAPQ